MSLQKKFPRLWSIEAGGVMVVTDMHGDWNTYRRYRDRFIALHSRGQADYLVFTGDLIHREDEQGDQSLEIVLDVLALQAEYGSAVIYLCGNHEMPHIYSINLSRGETQYTAPFEAAMSRGRHTGQVLALFDSLPFYVRTRAGVSITHAGAPAVIASPGQAQKLFNWSHQTILNWAQEIIAGEDINTLRAGYARMNHAPYDVLARHFLAVSNPNDPRYNNLLRGMFVAGHPWFNQLLWPALFTRCELEYGPADYAVFLDALLHELSVGYHPQQMLVTGHIPVRGGNGIVAQRQLRLASGQHAIPPEAGQYLLFDAATSVQSPEALLKGLAQVS
jgi:hypothetical protein